jgi:NAD(P)H-nitrite reductase large subunit
VSRFVIIGTGAAGVAAAEAIRSQDQSSELFLIGEEPDGYYSRPGLAYYLTNEIPENYLYPFDKKEFKRLNLRLLHARINNIFPQDHLVETHDGKKLRYGKLLIAVGASAARPQIPGIDLQGVVKLDDIKDTRQIIKLSKKARSAVVVGGGITALELVEGLRARKVKTHYLLRKDRYWGNVLDETESKIVESRLKSEGVHIHYRSEVEEILGKNGRVTGVLTKDGTVIKCSIAAFAIGIRPRKHLAESAGIETDRGILVNEYLQTNIPDIFAAGDVAQVYDPFSGKAILDSLWWPARLQGHTAGLNMTGQGKPYHKGVPFNVTRLAGLTTTIIGTVGNKSDDDLVGIARGDSETWRRIPDAIASQSNFDVNRLRLMVGEKTLLGAIVMGDQKISQYIQQIITQKIDISPIRDQLLQSNASIADLIIDFWTSRSPARVA